MTRREKLTIAAVIVSIPPLTWLGFHLLALYVKAVCGCN